MDLVVTKSNELIRASYKLTINEQRLVLACIAQLDPRFPIPKTRERAIRPIRVTVSDFAETFHLSDRSTAYTALQEATDRLYERDIKTFDENGRRHGRFRWVQAVEYHQRQGCVELTFTQNVTPYITLLHRHFTSYLLKQIASVNSIYAIRLFDLLMQFKVTGMVAIGLDELKLLLRPRRQVQPVRQPQGARHRPRRARAHRQGQPGDHLGGDPAESPCHLPALPVPGESAGCPRSGGLARAH
jgi:plasmid replication initiation protein